MAGDVRPFQRAPQPRDLICSPYRHSLPLEKSGQLSELGTGLLSDSQGRRKHSNFFFMILVIFNTRIEVLKLESQVSTAK